MHRPASSKKARHPTDQGAVLVVVMMVMMSVMALGMTALWLTTGNMQIGANVNLRTNALYVAEAGIEHARAILNDPALAPDVNGLLAGTAQSTAHPKNDIPSALRPLGAGAVMVDQASTALYDVAYPPLSFNRAVQVATGGGAATGTMGFYRVWIRNDQSEIRQGLFTADSNATIVIRSQGFAADSVDPITGAPRDVPQTNVVVEVTLGPTPTAGLNPNDTPPIPPELCNSGKNACDDNNSTQYGIVVN